MKQPVPSTSAVPWGSLLSLVTAILYGVSPIDLLPDVIPLLGWVDDAIAVPAFLGLSLLIFVRHRRLLKTRQPQTVDVPARVPDIPQTYDQATP